MKYGIKNNGFHDIKAKLEGRTTTESQRQQVRAGTLLHQEVVVVLLTRRTNAISTYGQQDRLRWNIFRWTLHLGQNPRWNYTNLGLFRTPIRQRH